MVRGVVANGHRDRDNLNFAESSTVAAALSGDPGQLRLPASVRRLSRGRSRLGEQARTALVIGIPGPGLLAP
jgi:hypothetical protein